MRDAYATPPCPHTDTSGDSRARWMTLWGLFLKGGPPAERCMGQDLDHNTVIIYFTTDDLIRFSPPILRERRKGDCVSACGVFACV